MSNDAGNKDLNYFSLNPKVEVEKKTKKNKLNKIIKKRSCHRFIVIDKIFPDYIVATMQIPGTNQKFIYFFFFSFSIRYNWSVFLTI